MEWIVAHSITKEELATTIIIVFHTKKRDNPCNFILWNGFYWTWTDLAINVLTVFLIVDAMKQLNRFMENAEKVYIGYDSL